MLSPPSAYDMMYTALNNISYDDTKPRVRVYISVINTELHLTTMIIIIQLHITRVCLQASAHSHPTKGGESEKRGSGVGIGNGVFSFPSPPFRFLFPPQLILQIEPHKLHFLLTLSYFTTTTSLLQMSSRYPLMGPVPLLLSTHQPLAMSRLLLKRLLLACSTTIPEREPDVTFSTKFRTAFKKFIQKH